MAKFTPEEIRMARQIEMLSYLESQNKLARDQGKIEPYQIEREGKDQYRLKDHGGLLFVRNAWNQRSSRKGGNTLDFVVEIERLPFNEAVAKLLNRQKDMELTKVNIQEKYIKPEIPFELPERNESFRRVIAYLNKTRGIDADLILSEIKKGNIYEDRAYHNVVFVGRNEAGEPAWAQKRTTLSNQKIVFDQPGSDSRYTYYYGPEKPKVLVTVESPIEALSLVSLMRYHGKDTSQIGYLSLGGVHDTALEHYLKAHPEVKNIITALNNDRAQKPHEIKGREASQIIKEKYHEKRGYYVVNIFPQLEDWNDELKKVRQIELEKKQKEQEKQPTRERSVEQQIRDYKKMKQQRAKELQKEKVPVRSRAR